MYQIQSRLALRPRHRWGTYGVSYDRRTLPRLLFHEPALVSTIGHFQLLDHGCETVFRPTYDSLTLPFISFAGRSRRICLVYRDSST